MTGTDAIELARDVSREEAFRQLADRHLSAGYRLARAILGEPGEAEDATHDAFERAWRQWATLRDPARFERWFDRILINTCRNRLRRAARVEVRDISAEVTAEPDPYTSVHSRDAIGQALAQLDSDHRVVVALRYYRDLSVDDIAHHLGIRPGTVKSRLHYALRRLQAQLEAVEAREAPR